MALLFGGIRADLVFGILGNVISVLVYLAPTPTFYTIYKRKTSRGFHAIPYSVALFSAMLLLYYAHVKRNSMMLITINSIGVAIETAYLIFYLVFATRASRIFTGKLLVLFNVGAFGSIVLFTSLFSTTREERTAVVGWICAVFSVCVFAAPLSIMRKVITTKSVEYMPLPLSCCLTLCAVMWLLYGLSIRDYFIATPNILGLLFGVAQIVLYAIYRSRKKSEVLPEINHRKDYANGVQMTTVADTTPEISTAVDVPPENQMTDDDEIQPEIKEINEPTVPTVTVIEVRV